MQSGRSEVGVTKSPECSRAVFKEAVEPKGAKNDKDSEDNSEEEELGIYDNNWRSDHMKYQEEMLSKVKRYLTTRDLSELGVMTVD